MSGSIELENVSFSYADESTVILKNFNLKIDAGKFYLIYGSSGAGKSTLLNLLMTQLLPSHGQIMFDGQDVASLDLEMLRGHFGVVRQNPTLFAGSVIDNIICGRDLPVRKVEDLLLGHQAFDALLDLPMGLQTFIYWHAKNLSRQEQVLVLLARALVHEPKILFLDEAFLGISRDEMMLISELINDLPITRILVSHQSDNLFNAKSIPIKH